MKQFFDFGNVQYNGQKKKDERTNNDLQNTTQTNKDGATRTSQKPDVTLGAFTFPKSKSNNDSDL
jgi:hypothetical protein